MNIKPPKKTPPLPHDDYDQPWNEDDPIVEDINHENLISNPRFKDYQNRSKTKTGFNPKYHHKSSPFEYLKNSKTNRNLKSNTVGFDPKTTTNIINGIKQPDPTPPKPKIEPISPIPVNTDKFHAHFKHNKTYEIVLNEIKDNFLYFTYQDQVFRAELYDLIDDQVLNQEKDQIHVNLNPFDKTLYYTKTKYLLKHDIVSLYKKRIQQSRLNIKGVFEVKINKLTFNPIRTLFNEHNQIIKKPFPGFRVDYAFIETIAKEDHLFLSITDDATFKIDSKQTIDDLERINQILVKTLPEKSLNKRMRDILNRNMEELKKLSDQINHILKEKLVVLTLVSKFENGKLVSQLAINDQNFNQYLIDFKKQIELEEDPVETTS